MYYIKLTQYGWIGWQQYGFTDFLKLDRYKITIGMCAPYEFPSYDEAQTYCNWYNARHGRNHCRVVDIDDPFVQKWLSKNTFFYKQIENRIEVVA